MSVYVCVYGRRKKSSHLAPVQRNGKFPFLLCFRLISVQLPLSSVSVLLPFCLMDRPFCSSAWITELIRAVTST